MAKIISLVARPGAIRPTNQASPETRAQILFFTGVRYERLAPQTRRASRKPKRIICAAAAVDIIA